MENKRYTGTVIWFSANKGFGFIKADDPTVNNGNDLFVHFFRIVQRGFKSLKKGERVEFSIGENHKGTMAEDVKLIGDSAMAHHTWEAHGSDGGYHD